MAKFVISDPPHKASDFQSDVLPIRSAYSQKKALVVPEVLRLKAPPGLTIPSSMKGARVLV
jgi:hypothetical protein